MLLSLPLRGGLDVTEKASVTPKARIPVYIITGMLGAGKTTFIKNVMQQIPGDEIRVVVSEASPMGVDQLTLGLDNPEDLVAGCVCCVGFDAALKTLLGISDGVDNKTTKVILETSGISDPTTLLFELSKDPRFFQLFTVSGVITLVDCMNASVQSERYQEWTAQVQLSDVIYLSHLDSVRPSERSAVLDRVTSAVMSINRNVQILGADARDRAKLIFDIKIGRSLRGEQPSLTALAPQNKLASTHDQLLCAEIEFKATSNAADVLAFCQAVVCMVPTLARMKLLVAMDDTVGDFYLAQVVMGKIQALERVTIKNGLTLSRLYIIDDHVKEAQVAPLVELFFDTKVDERCFG
ncbi:hypothetical protein A584_28326 [Pseudomonas syringae pv. theae ICMP 3923]|uniref:CobW/HypB/UreG nucleotide-binding domain-containing protein n=2 Tax=Pseudomonas syringae TaxID=317 RepID=A0A0Q0EUY5_PSESX|nr:GTP-binding protein [Pseudomonas syringae]EPM65518.1 hypothetical protein A584_28326 [Pseudomonas syringae pv. theae ICMP 3923]KPZ35046.1 hypothetical protein AN901_200587 [Pseudomonas syringae pv. theae]MBL3873041.1 hypothetical protein [Pseudomonas syringae pv. theae]RMT63259.1 hypothetical protein ALP44_01264 [Pseudomonas syringae pv. theae]GKQ33263.1 hypothetical protein PSTH68_27110 [Pseudomonas syringae pv. theae]